MLGASADGALLNTLSGAIKTRLPGKIDGLGRPKPSGVALRGQTA
jgi:hypothetical protein